MLLERLVLSVLLLGCVCMLLAVGGHAVREQLPFFQVLFQQLIFHLRILQCVLPLFCC